MNRYSHEINLVGGFGMFQIYESLKERGFLDSYHLSVPLKGVNDKRKFSERITFIRKSTSVTFFLPIRLGRLKGAFIRDFGIPEKVIGDVLEESFEYGNHVYVKHEDLIPSVECFKNPKVSSISISANTKSQDMVCGTKRGI